jgi:hypothetical protein
MAIRATKKAPIEVDEKTMKALAKKASGLGNNEGNKRLQAITNRILLDLLRLTKRGPPYLTSAAWDLKRAY